MKSPIIKNSTILVTCMNEGCDRTFRIPEYKFNSTIKNNPNKQECNICKNQKLLAQSTLYRKNKRTEYRTINNATLKKGTKKQSKNTPKQNLRNSADSYFSKYIRLLYSFESNGKRYCNCFTCNTPIPIKHSSGRKNGAELGHWQRRGYYNVRFNEDNGRPQCHQCNYYHQGKPEVFEQKLIEQLGIDKVNEIKLLAQKDTGGNENTLFLKEQVDKYKSLLNQLLKDLRIKSWARL